MYGDACISLGPMGTTEHSLTRIIRGGLSKVTGCKGVGSLKEIPQKRVVQFPQNYYHLWAMGMQDERREVTRTWRSESGERPLEKGSGVCFRDTASPSPPLRNGLGD